MGKYGLGKEDENGGIPVVGQLLSVVYMFYAGRDKEQSFRRQSERSNPGASRCHDKQPYCGWKCPLQMSPPVTSNWEALKPCIKEVGERDAAKQDKTTRRGHQISVKELEQEAE